ncbi:MAG: cyclic lactone autoinducer peptide [Lachnospiraceae bacterium]|nr:cyclic lactone autoinducer peptide [Lachnospiraceae bacterium]
MDFTTKKLSFENSIPQLIAALGALFALFGANSACCLILHQPEKPDLSKLRRF